MCFEVIIFTFEIFFLFSPKFLIHFYKKKDEKQNQQHILN